MKAILKSFLVVMLGLLLSSCSLSLAEDITPPPGAEIMPVVRTQSSPSSDPLFPLVPPDPANGQVIYNEKCADCHGISGQGDGPRASQLPNPVPPLASVNLARQATPSKWFSIVTNGNLDRFMPPFPSLSDSQRWDVVAYALSISTSPASIEQGEQLYLQLCSDCHGELGRGDGVEAAFLAKLPRNLADLAFMAEKSAQDLHQSIMAGVSPAMPAFGQWLSDEEIWTLADYLRSLAFTMPPEIALETGNVLPQEAENLQPTVKGTPTEPAPRGYGVVTGRVINGSGGYLPADMQIVLRGFDDVEQVITYTTTLDASGSFVFPMVEMIEGRILIATTDFSQFSYGSDITVIPPNATSIDLPITVYETTTDTSVIKADRLHLFFELLDEETIRVVELYIMSNTSNKTLVPIQPDQPVVRFKLPVGSRNLEFQDGLIGERYLETPDGFADSVPVRPGTGFYQVLFSFEMPYNRKLDFAQPVWMPVDAVVILVPEGDIRIKGEMIEDDGTRDIQGTLYHVYNGAGITAGEDIRLNVTGRLGGSALSLNQSARNSLIVGLGIFGLALIVAGFWIYRHAQYQIIDDQEEAELAAASASPEGVEALMDAIIALDDLYQIGDLPDDAYLKRRTELKNRLQEVMQSSQPDSRVGHPGNP